MMLSEMEDVEDMELTDTEKAVIASNDKSGVGTHAACHFCGLQFDVKKTRSLRAHIEEVHVVGESGFMCGICCEEFDTRKAVENHMSTLHRTPRPMGCGVCGETFRVRNLLLKHIDSHSKDDIVNKKTGLCYCGECFEFFENVMSLQSHVLNHRESPVFVCAACGLQTRYRHVMVKHLETHVISNLLSASEDKKETSDYFPQTIQLDESRIITGEETIQQDMDTLDIVSSFVEGEEVNCADHALIAEQEEANYKCGVCDAFFTNLAEALTHAGHHQDGEDSMPQVEINVLLEEEKNNTLPSSAELDGVIDSVKTEFLDTNSLNVE